jgi:hypothetical protein
VIDVLAKAVIDMGQPTAAGFQVSQLEFRFRRPAVRVAWAKHMNCFPDDWNICCIRDSPDLLFILSRWPGNTLR